MSITYGLSLNYLRVRMVNPHTLWSESFDDLYNPQFVSEDIYPTLNVSNSNAAAINKALSLGSYQGGQLKLASIPDFLEKKLIPVYLAALQGKYDAVGNSFESNARVCSYMRRLEFIFKTAIILHDHVSWG